MRAARHVGLKPEWGEEGNYVRKMGKRLLKETNQRIKDSR